MFASRDHHPPLFLYSCCTTFFFFLNSLLWHSVQDESQPSFKQMRRSGDCGVCFPQHRCTLFVDRRRCISAPPQLSGLTHWLFSFSLSGIARLFIQTRKKIISDNSRETSTARRNEQQLTNHYSPCHIGQGAVAPPADNVCLRPADANRRHITIQSPYRSANIIHPRWILRLPLLLPRWRAIPRPTDGKLPMHPNMHEYVLCVARDDRRDRVVLHRVDGAGEWSG